MTQPDDQKNQQPSDLAGELRELGQQLEQAVRTTLESERAKQVQADIAAGMKEIGAQLQHAMRAIQENPQFQNLVHKGEQAVGQAQQSKAAQDLQDSLSRGVAMLNDQIAGFITRLRQGDGSTPPAGDSAPATGETTRLDPDQK
jgi:BMFP domain-containing protein YqiC